MTNGDFERTSQRQKILLDLSNTEFPNTVIEESTPEDPWRIRIEIDTPRKIALVLQPERSIMEDTNNNFELIFGKGIELAKRVFKDPPLDNNIFQGRILLDNNGVELRIRNDIAQ